MGMEALVTRVHGRVEQGSEAVWKVLGSPIFYSWGLLKFLKKATNQEVNGEYGISRSFTQSVNSIYSNEKTRVETVPEINGIDAETSV